ncbi:MAG: TIGR02281 family clan AA aspartic protease [Candidatus Binatia bacterium]
MRKSILAPVTVLALLLLASWSHPGELFRWVDERGVVHFSDNLHNIPEKYRNAASRMNVPESPKRPEGAYELNKASIPFLRKGEVMVVKATVNERVSANFVVDTGASYTMISRATAKELDIDLERKLPTIPFQTVNGTIQAPLVTLDSVELGGMRIRDLTAAVHDISPDPGSVGLLGLNFLNNFRMDIDMQGQVLVLEKK